MARRAARRRGRSRPRPLSAQEGSALRQLAGEILDVGGERRHLQRCDRTRGARLRNPGRGLERAFRRDYAGSLRARSRWRARTSRRFPPQRSAAATGSTPSVLALRSAASAAVAPLAERESPAPWARADRPARASGRACRGFRAARRDRSQAARARPRGWRHRPGRSGATSVRRTGAARRANAAPPAHRDRSARATAWAGYRRPRGGRASSARRSREIAVMRSCRATRTSEIVRLKPISAGFNGALRKTICEDVRPRAAHACRISTVVAAL